MKSGGFAAFVVASLAARASWAAAGAATPPPLGTGSALLQGLLGLLLVLAALMAFFWFMRRFAPGQAAAQGVVKVVGGVMLGARERLVVVEVGDTWLLLGVGAGQVNALHVLPRPPGTQVPAAPAPMATFSDRLKEALQRRKGG